MGPYGGVPAGDVPVAGVPASGGSGVRVCEPEPVPTGPVPVAAVPVPLWESRYGVAPPYCVGTYACAPFGRRPSAAWASICSASDMSGRVFGSLRSRETMTGVSGPACWSSAASSSTTACMVVSGVVRRNGERPSTAV